MLQLPDAPPFGLQTLLATLSAHKARECRSAFQKVEGPRQGLRPQGDPPGYILFMNIAFLYLINVRRFTWLQVIENLAQLVASGSCAAVMVYWANQN